MQSEVQLAEANSKEKLLPLDQYLKDCWAKKQTAIDLTAYKITHEELNKVIFGIHYEEPEYYSTIRNDITDTDPQTGLLKTYYPYYSGETGSPFDSMREVTFSTASLEACGFIIMIIVCYTPYPHNGFLYIGSVC